MSNLYCLPGRAGGSPGYARPLSFRALQRFDFFVFFFFATFLAVLFFLPTAFRPADDFVFFADFLATFFEDFLAADFFGGACLTGALCFFFGAAAAATTSSMWVWWAIASSGSDGGT